MYYQIGVCREKISDLYTYQFDLDIVIGQLVIVDFNYKKCIGLVLGKSTNCTFTGVIKPILQVLNFTISNGYIDFIQFVSHYNLIPLGSALKLLIPFKKFKYIQSKPVEDLITQSVTLNDEQQIVVDNISKNLGKFYPVLLHGVTGSGKTEVFLSVINKLKAQILILVPEIALSNALAQKISQRCQSTVFIWHNAISNNKKLTIWQMAIKGDQLIVVGARSALFIPFSNLQLIVIDEEHDITFKQTEHQIYHARNMAVYLAKCLHIPIILSSATPSLETYKNAMEGKYQYIKLNNKFFNFSQLQDIKIQDMSNTSDIFHPESIKEIQKYLNLKQQILIFVNRRGYAPKKLCKTCGWKVLCPRCDTWLCYHAQTNKLVCHYCGYDTFNITKCKKCGNNYLINIGIGIEKVYAECVKLFPNKKIIMCSSDNMNTANKIEKIINEINKDVDIILGTQILAKGHNFNKLNLVVITNIDYMMYSSDFRALEHTFQLLNQLAGRAGRTGTLQSKIIVQTYNKNELIFPSLNEFYNQELQNRKLLHLPPYSVMASINLSGKNLEEVKNTAIEISTMFNKSIQVIGPITPTIYKLKNNYRYRVILIAEKNLQSYIQKVKLPKSKSVKINIDINPYDL